MSTTAPEPEVVAQYARDALQNARDLITEAKILMASECWARACYLAVLASEEAAKAVMTGLRSRINRTRPGLLLAER